MSFIKPRRGNPKPQNRGAEMAIFRAETKSISRSKGHNLVAAISYRAGIKLTDKNKLNPLAKDYDFTKKTDVVHSEILLPKVLSDQLDAVGIDLDFQSIADLVEQGETTLRGKMKNSARLGREWILCGVPELSRAENIELFQKFASEQAEEQGVVSMCFVHDPKAGNDTRSKSGAANATVPDERNIHAHIVLLTRKLELTPTNKLKLGSKSDSELSNDERTRPVVAKELVGTVDPDSGEKIQQGRGLCSNSEWLKDVRKSWADMLNEKLLEKNVQPVSHKSYRELGLDILPKIHHGNNELTDAKKAYNDKIDERNRNRAVIKSAADSRIAIITKSAERYDRESKHRADYMLKADKWLSKASADTYDAEQAVKRFDEQTIIFNRLAERANTVLTKPPRVVRKLDTPTKMPVVKIGVGGSRLSRQLDELHQRHDLIADKIDNGEMYEREVRLVCEDFFIATQITCEELNNAICRVPDKYDMEKYETVYQAVDKLMGSIEQRMEDVGLNGVREHKDATDKLQAMRQCLDTHATRIDLPTQRQQPTPQNIPRP